MNSTGFTCATILRRNYAPDISRRLEAEAAARRREDDQRANAAFDTAIWILGLIFCGGAGALYGLESNRNVRKDYAGLPDPGAELGYGGRAQHAGALRAAPPPKLWRAGGRSLR